MSISNVSKVGGDPGEEARATRRNLITTTPNPLLSLDFVSTLKGQVMDQDGNAGVEIEIRYVPDKLVYEVSGFPAYLSQLSPVESGLEEIGAIVLEDFNNELVPRWIHVRLTLSKENSGDRSGIVMEDRQPDWDNAALLARLERY